MTEFEIGYVMGVIAGEGSFTGDRRQPALAVKMSDRDADPLRELARLIGGQVFGPYASGNRRYFTFLLRGPALRGALPLFDRYLPAGHKREQFERWRERYAGQLAPAAAPQLAR